MKEKTWIGSALFLKHIDPRKLRRLLQPTTLLGYAGKGFLAKSETPSWMARTLHGRKAFRTSTLFVSIDGLEVSKAWLWIEACGGSKAAHGAAKSSSDGTSLDLFARTAE